MTYDKLIKSYKDKVKNVHNAKLILKYWNHSGF